MENVTLCRPACSVQVEAAAVLGLVGVTSLDWLAKLW